MNPSSNSEAAPNTFADVMALRLSRRAVLNVAATALAAGAIGGAGDGPAALADDADAGGTRTSSPAPASPAEGEFAPLMDSTADAVTVAEGHAVDVLARWGDPLFADAPDFDPAAQTAAAQARQFGYNCDYTALLPLDGAEDRALLVVNHEFVNPELMFAGYDRGRLSAELVAIEQAAHGMSVVEVARGGDGRWSVVRDGRFNRRVTAQTPCTITGPAAGDERLRTAADPGGRNVLGTLGNCAGGVTPWGTVLSGEENVQKYFGGLGGGEGGFEGGSTTAGGGRNGGAAGGEAGGAAWAARAHARFGMLDASDFGWERVDRRFDGRTEPNEAFRFGWVVEIDPLDPASAPRKRTALGRFKHEGAATAVAADGRVALYSGDDERFEYVYKFVSRGPARPGGAAANDGVLDDGTLYAARFDPDGTGEWLPLVHGQGPLTAANGYASQAEVLIDTRGAADLLGPTKMDRPEDIEASPATGKVYIALTNNDSRGGEGFPPVDPANPRAVNTFGHVIELAEDGGDAASTRFRWEVFLLCGDPSDPSTYFGGFDKAHVSAIANPDNLTFDPAGGLWIATDGQPVSLEQRDGLYAVTTDGPSRGRVRRFLAAPAGAEVCGPTFSPDGHALFVAIQHPGEGTTLAAPSSRWPDGAGPPRPSVVAVRRVGGGRVGDAGGDGASRSSGSTGRRGRPAWATWLAIVGGAAAAVAAWLRRRAGTASALDANGDGAPGRERPGHKDGAG